jgi:two-component system LytT family sensor kinase
VTGAVATLKPGRKTSLEARITTHHGGRAITRSRSKRILLWLGIWTLAALFWSAQNLVRSVVTGRPIDWVAAVGFEFLYWTPFVLLTPFLLYMVRRFRLEPGRLRRSLLLHGAGAVTFAFAQTVAFFALEYAAALALEFPPERVDALIANMRVGFWLLVLTSLWKYWVIVGLWYAFDYYRRYREREARAAQLEARLATSQLQALRMQLQPHFLFNTLHSVSMLNLTDANAANRVLVKLSELLRITLERNSSQEVPLETEIDFLDRYLEIESIRFQDRLDVRFLLDDDVQDALVPNFALQPLVENAIRHGISKSSEAGAIEVRAQEQDGKLVLEVVDDGPGLPPGWVADRDSGLGLNNTRARLEHLYGTAGQLEVVNSLGGGLTARITIPLRHAGGSRPGKESATS